MSSGRLDTKRCPWTNLASDGHAGGWWIAWESTAEEPDGLDSNAPCWRFDPETEWKVGCVIEYLDGDGNSFECCALDELRDVMTVGVGARLFKERQAILDDRERSRDPYAYHGVRQSDFL